MGSRRTFLQTAGLAAAAASLTLRSDAEPTEGSGGAGDYGSYLTEKPSDAAEKLAKWAVTEDNIKGPFHRVGAPYRGKITPPMIEGEVLLIRGHVYAFDTKKTLANAIVDIWQANHHGRYDNDDPKHQPASAAFSYRARLITDENGMYEYETIMPGRYKIGPKQWRPSHIHYWVEHVRYRPLITQLYFKGNPQNAKDPFIKKSLIIDLKKKKTKVGTYRTGTFDIVLGSRRS